MTNVQCLASLRLQVLSQKMFRQIGLEVLVVGLTDNWRNGLLS